MINKRRKVSLKKRETRSCSNTGRLNNIQPAIQKSEKELSREYNSTNTAFVNKTIENNVQRIRDKSTLLNEIEANGEIKIVGGVYHISNGEVILL
ncbi:carbonic anhydrase [uncultured Polaribacter sp.]|uniref:carbonic anhydrase n=1 Tax=uncultured Polaribacter sp. TaxID=174711 RepID=UPI0032B10FCF